MKKVKHRLAAVLALITLAQLYSTATIAQTTPPCEITGVAVQAGGCGIAWESRYDRHIIQRTSSLKAGFDFAGDVLQTNSAFLENQDNCQFFRIRRVRRITLPDTRFEQAVRKQLPRKFAPTNELYDIDAESVKTLNVSTSSIVDLTGVNEFRNLTNLSCRGNSLRNLAITSCPALKALSCSGNSLTNLSITGCASLAQLDCSGNMIYYQLNLGGLTALREINCMNSGISELDVSGSTNLQAVYAIGNPLNYIRVRDPANPPPVLQYDGDVIICDAQKMGPPISVQGVVVYQPFEGGFYGIGLYGNRDYFVDTHNLPASFRQDGLMVNVVLKVRHDMWCIHMCGPIAEVVSISVAR